MTGQPGGVDIGLMTNLEHRPAHRTGKERHVGHRDRQHRMAEPRPERGDDGEREQQVGEGHQDIDATHQQRIDKAAEEAREDADQRADQCRDQGRQQPDREARAGPPDQARQQVAAERIGAEQMAGCPGRQHALGRLGQRRIGERQPGRGERRQEDERQQAQPDHGARVAQ